MQLLNGTWKFQYFNSIYDIQDSFFEKNYDTENFDEIQVPSVWQMAGYDTHQYTNIRYPFPFDPYIKELSTPSKFKKAFGAFSSL